MFERRNGDGVCDENRTWLMEVVSVLGDGKSLSYLYPNLLVLVKGLSPQLRQHANRFRGKVKEYETRNSRSQTTSSFIQSLHLSCIRALPDHLGVTFGKRTNGLIQALLDQESGAKLQGVVVGWALRLEENKVFRKSSLPKGSRHILVLILIASYGGGGMHPS